MPKPHNLDPMFNNASTRTHAFGCAVDLTEQNIYYASTAGPATSVKAIWASIANNNRKNRISITPWFHTSTSFDGPPKNVGVAYADIPGSSYKHMALRYKGPELILIADQRGLLIPDPQKHQNERKAITRTYLPQVLQHFTEYLNAETELPALAAWSPTIWKTAFQEGAIKPLDSFGDCLGAWLIDLRFNWLELVQTLITSNQIQFDYELLDN